MVSSAYWNDLKLKLEAFRKEMEEQFKPFLNELSACIRELPVRTQNALILLGKKGWYMDTELSFPELWILEKLLEEGKIKKAEDALCDYFETHLDKIECIVVENFPHRAHLVRPAFNAHRKQDFALSIPVFLIQSEGLFVEVMKGWKVSPYSNWEKSTISEYLKQTGNRFLLEAILSPLGQSLPIKLSKRDRPEGFNELNRHQVLHGESLNYPTKTNSLKAISFINYISYLAQILKG